MEEEVEEKLEEEVEDQNGSRNFIEGIELYNEMIVDEDDPQF